MNRLMNKKRNKHEQGLKARDRTQCRRYIWKGLEKEAGSGTFAKEGTGKVMQNGQGRGKHIESGLRINSNKELIVKNEPEAD